MSRAAESALRASGDSAIVNVSSIAGVRGVVEHVVRRTVAHGLLVVAAELLGDELLRVVEDLRLEAELLSDEKERAEHVMLVDLARNDIGRVCDYQSVEVKDLMIIERYSLSLIHI